MFKFPITVVVRTSSCSDPACLWIGLVRDLASKGRDPPTCRQPPRKLDPKGVSLRDAQKAAVPGRTVETRPGVPDAMSVRGWRNHGWVAWLKKHLMGMHWYMSEKQRATVSSNSRFQTVPTVPHRGILKRGSETKTSLTNHFHLKVSFVRILLFGSPFGGG